MSSLRYNYGDKVAKVIKSTFFPGLVCSLMNLFCFDLFCSLSRAFEQFSDYQ